MDDGEYTSFLAGIEALQNLADTLLKGRDATREERRYIASMLLAPMAPSAEIEFEPAEMNTPNVLPFSINSKEDQPNEPVLESTEPNDLTDNQVVLLAAHEFLKRFRQDDFQTADVSRQVTQLAHEKWFDRDVSGINVSRALSMIRRRSIPWVRSPGTAGGGAVLKRNVYELTEAGNTEAGQLLARPQIGKTGST